MPGYIIAAMTIRQEAAIKKAYEISYALFRVAGTGLKKPYAEQLESLALSILGSAASLRFEDLKSALEATGYVLRLGGDVGLISNKHKDVLLHEIAGLERISLDLGREEGLPDLDIARLFKQPEYGKVKSGKESGKSAKIMNPAKSGQDNPATENLNPAKTEPMEDKSGNVKERHSKVIDFIRQSGNCRLKDIHDALPDYSERTLRYDLQALIEGGVVERIGGGGPSTYYRLHIGIPSEGSAVRA